MASLQITIEIDDEATPGYALDKLSRIAGDDVGAILDRIGRANQATFPGHKYEPVDIILKTVAAAVIVAEA